MLAKLALGNIRKLLHDYTVYFLTLVLGVAVFYAFNTMAVQADFLQGDVGAMLRQVGRMLSYVTVFLAVVMGFLMVYANNFLMRRRQKELGLYQVLGMRPGQVNAILSIETILVAAASLLVGLGVGVLLSQLLLFVTAGMFQATITHFRFFFSADALLLTLGCFVLTFLVMMVLNSITLSRVRLIDLMGSSVRGEKNHLRSLPLSVVSFVAGVAMVAVAYWRLQTQGFPSFSPNTTNADFLLTTALVTAGTVVLFFGLAGTMTGVLSRMRGVYWSGLNMFTTRQIASRVNTACVSMSVIAMILFLAITSVTGGMSICNAVNESALESVPYDASIMVGGSSHLDATGGVANTPIDVPGMLRQAGVDLDSLGTWASVSQRSIVDEFSATGDYGFVTFQGMSDATGVQLPNGFEHTSAAMGVSISDLNAVRALQGLDPVQLADGQYLVLSNMPKAMDFLNQVLQIGYALRIQGTELLPASQGVISDGSTALGDTMMASTPCVIVLPDAVASQCQVYATTVDVNYSMGTEEGDQRLKGVQDRLRDQAAQVLEQQGTESQGAYYFEVTTRTSALQEGTTTTGLISYLAIYIGFVLVVACAAILAIQQLSEASDSSVRYRTLSELGCSDSMIYGSLLTQVAIMFVLPLVVAVAHSVCALSVIIGLVQTFGIVNMASSSILAVAIFVLVYGGYLVVTYRTAHGVVHGALRSARHAL